MPKRTQRTQEPQRFGTKVAFGANAEQRLTVILFGDPTEPGSLYFTFTPEQTRELAAEWLKQADIAEGKQQAPLPVAVAATPRQQRRTH